MGAATPDAYRVGAGSATPDYPGGVPARSPEQPVMPGTPSATAPVAKETFAPAASSVLKDGHPQIAALSPDVERTIIARVPPRDRYPAIPKSSPITKPTPVVRSAPEDEYTSAVVTPSASTYPQRSAEPSAPVRPPALPTPPLSRFTPQDVTSEAREEVASDREYAHHDEANAPFFGDGGEDDWNAERDLPSRADVALSRRLGPTRAVPGDQVVARLSEAEKERRREARAYRYEELDQRPPLRRERPKRHKRIKRGLGMFAFGLFTRRQTKDRLVPLIAIASPVLCYALDWWINKETGYKFGYELLMLNGSLTFAGLMLLSGKEKTAKTP